MQKREAYERFSDADLYHCASCLLGYIVWLLKRQKKDRDANSKGTMLLLRVQLIDDHDRYTRQGEIPGIIETVADELSSLLEVSVESSFHNMDNY